MNICISSIGSSTAVGIFKCIRNLGKNHKIIGLDINNLGYTAGSLLVDKFYKIPQYNETNFISELLKILSKENIELFIPIHDFEIKEVAKNINNFKNIKIIIPDINIVELFSDKYIATSAINNLGILTPAIIDSTYKGISILRKKTSVGSKGIKIIEDSSTVTANEDEFLQELIIGEEYTVDILSDLKGRPIIIIPRKRLEVKSGVATKVQLVYDVELINNCMKILQNYIIPGLSNVQFIKSSDNKYYFIELNTRFGGMSISSVLGSYNYIEDFLMLEKTNSNLSNNLDRVKWNSIITRYYEEVLYNG